MNQRVLKLQGVTSEDRHEMIGRIKDALNDGNGYILDFKMFSNKAVCIKFEVSAGNLAKLHESLSREAILNDESLKKLAECAGQAYEFGAAVRNEDVKGALNMTFNHDKPDLRIDTPPIPG